MEERERSSSSISVADVGPVRSMRRRVSLFLLAAIALPTLVVTGWFANEIDAEHRRQVDAVMEEMEHQVLAAFSSFEALLAEDERRLNRSMADELPKVAASLAAAGSPEAIPLRTLEELARKHRFDHLYVIDRRTVVVNTNFGPDMGFELGEVSPDLRRFLGDLLGSGRLFVDRLNVSSKTGVLKKYAYYSPAGSDYIYEGSVDMVDYLARTRSPDYASFLFGDLFGNVVADRGLITDVGLFIVNDINFFPFLAFSRDFDPSASRRLPQEETIRYERGDRTIIYHLIHLPGGRLQGAEYMAIKMTVDLSPLRGLTRNLTLLAAGVTLVSVLASLAVATGFFSRRVVARVERIGAGLARIAVGEYDTPIDAGVNDEIGWVARQVDWLRLRLMSRDRELAEARDRLEDRVEERTADLGRANAELTDARDEAESATRLKDKFLTLVAHDLKSPLLGLKGMADLLRERKRYGVDEAEADEMLGQMGRSLDALATLIQTLLDISRLQTGSLTLRKEWIYPAALAEDALAAITPRAAQKGITLVNEVDPDVRLLADPTLYGGVIANLLANGIKFTPAGGEVVVFTPEGDRATVAVRDTGPGVEPEFVANLFRHEVKTVSVGSAGEIGTGLGLPYSADIMRAHGGGLTVDSRLGRGATFFATLPEIDRVILIVDDQDVHRTMMKEALASVAAGIGFVEAGDGREGLEGVIRVSPALIVADLMMGGMDGYTFLEQLAKRGVTTPVVVATSLSADETVGGERVGDRVKRLGAAALASKPIDAVTFAAVVARLLTPADPEGEGRR
jgi:signal transduction histidine kinase/ActR/RegA family two-component response regulator